MYDSCVASILDYSSEVFGFENYPSKQNVQLRAIRAFLGVPKNSCNAALLSEFDWLKPQFKGQLRIFRFFDRLLRMNDNRLTKKVFMWDKRLNDLGIVSTWSSDLKDMLESCNLTYLYESVTPFPVRFLANK